MTETTTAAPPGETRQTTGTTQTQQPTTGTTQAATTTTQQTGQTPGSTQTNASRDAFTWGDNWRQQYAGEDPKLLQRLERYQSPKAALDALIAAQNRISSGELKAPLPQNATPEQIAEYRQANGIPEKPEGYFEKLPDGLVIGDADKPLFDSFAKGLHDLNAPPQIAQYAVKWYNDFQEQQLGKLAETDNTHKAATEDTLRAEWGNDYRTNINHITSFLSTAPEGVADLLSNARGADGKAILNDPGTVKWLATLAREFNPVGTIVPAGGNPMQGIENRKAELTKMMGNSGSEYWKGPQANKLQAEYRDLVDAELKLKARGAA